MVRLIAIVAVVVALIGSLVFVALSVNAGEHAERDLALLQTLIMAVETPILVAGLFALVLRVYRDYRVPRVSIGVASGAVSRATVAFPLQSSATADNDGTFTLILFNRSARSIRDVQLGIHALDANGQPFPLDNVEAGQIESELQFKSIRTSAAYSYLTPRVPYTLALKPRTRVDRPRQKLVVSVVWLKSDRYVAPNSTSFDVEMPGVRLVTDDYGGFRYEVV